MRSPRGERIASPTQTSSPEKQASLPPTASSKNRSNHSDGLAPNFCAKVQIRWEFFAPGGWLLARARGPLPPGRPTALSALQVGAVEALQITRTKSAIVCYQLLASHGRKTGLDLLSFGGMVLGCFVSSVRSVSFVDS
jgi:hypothetical protein